MIEEAGIATSLGFLVAAAVDRFAASSNALVGLSATLKSLFHCFWYTFRQKFEETS